MLTRTFKLLALLPCLLLLVATSFAQPKDNKPAASESQWVDFSGFKGKVFDIKHRDPRELVQVLQPLGSGFKGAMIQASSEYKTLTVRDFPENIAAIEEAIKRLDVPLLSRSESSVELRLHVLLSTTGAPAEQPPTELKEVIKQLQSTLAFKNYQLVTTIVQRAKQQSRYQGHNAVQGNGNARWIESVDNGAGGINKSQGGADYEYFVRGIATSSNPAGATVVQLDHFYFKFGKSSVQTDLEVRSGEKLVVGTSGFGDKAMILVLTATVLK